MTPTEIVRAHVDDECIDITTIGRRTGNAHRIEIWFGVLLAITFSE